MLRELSVHNLALIEDVRVELRHGFCAWTGETGAGKTLLLEGLGLLLGERGSSDLIRDGADELRVVGRFDVEQADLRSRVEQQLGYPLPEPELIVARRLSRQGRSYGYVNEQPVSIGTLKQLGQLLVDIHGQRESQLLLEPAYQLQLLDAFGKLEPARLRYEECAQHVHELRRRLQELTVDRQQRQRELSLLRFEREELDQAELTPGEFVELSQERERLVHAQALMGFAQLACGRLHDEEASIIDQLGVLQRKAEHWQDTDAALTEVVRRLQSMSSEVGDLTATLRGMAQRWEADPQRLEFVEDRVRKLRRLEAKYGKTIEELIEYRGTLDDSERRLSDEESTESAVREELNDVFTELLSAGGELRKQRQRVAKKLSQQIQQQLVDLNMADARLEALLETLEIGDDPLASEVPTAGFDQMELMLAANPGEPARPLRRVASGGELSRTMLAVKSVLAAHDRVGTLVFDEIDANVGGRLGDVLGEKLAMLGKSHQVLCVTHLPQVAAFASQHWTIRKQRDGKRTVTTIDRLDESARVDELASMMRGKARNETTRKEAASMLKSARKHW